MTQKGIVKQVKRAQNISQLRPSLMVGMHLWKRLPLEKGV